MAQNDYIVDPGSAEVRFKNVPVATYDVEKKTVKEYVNDGAKRKRWIAEALKKAPDAKPDQKFDIESDSAFETAIAIAEYEEDFYVHFPSAPRPANNPVGYLHIDVYQWVKKHFEPIVEYMYPNGPWTPLHAGMGRNRTIRPLDEAEKAIQFLN